MRWPRFLRREPGLSPEFRRRMDMVVTRARAETVEPGRHAIAYGPDGPLRPGAATALAKFTTPTKDLR